MKSFFATNRGRQRAAVYQQQAARRDIVPPNEFDDDPSFGGSEPQIAVVTALHDDAPGVAVWNRNFLKRLSCRIVASSGVKLGDAFASQFLIEAPRAAILLLQGELKSSAFRGQGHLVLVPTDRTWTLSAVCPAADDAAEGTAVLLRTVGVNQLWTSSAVCCAPQTGLPLLFQHLLVSLPPGDFGLAELDALVTVFESSFGGRAEVAPGVSLAVLAHPSR